MAPVLSLRVHQPISCRSRGRGQCSDADCEASSPSLRCSCRHACQAQRYLLRRELSRSNGARHTAPLVCRRNSRASMDGLGPQALGPLAGAGLCTRKPSPGTTSLTTTGKIPFRRRPWRSGGTHRHIASSGRPGPGGPRTCPRKLNRFRRTRRRHVCGAGSRVP